MHFISHPVFRQTRMRQAIVLALSTALSAGTAIAQDQTAPEPRTQNKAQPQSSQSKTAPVKPAATAGDEAQTVLVVGTRASQQSALAGKKNALNAVDMIVAEDVGSFPDRNVAEAISRVSGISLDRGDGRIDVGLDGGMCAATVLTSPGWKSTAWGCRLQAAPT